MKITNNVKFNSKTKSDRIKEKTIRSSLAQGVALP